MVLPAARAPGPAAASIARARRPPQLLRVLRAGKGRPRAESGARVSAPNLLFRPRKKAGFMSNIENKSDGLRELLARDHRELDGVFDALSNALRADARADALRLWGAFEDGLCSHMAVEEKHILPFLRKQDPVEVDALLEEHDEIRAKLTELGVGVDLHEVGSPAVDDFIAQLRRHAQREEALAYSWAEEHVPAPEQQDIRVALGLAQALRRRLGELGRKARARVLSTR